MLINDNPFFIAIPLLGRNDTCQPLGIAVNIPVGNKALDIGAIRTIGTECPSPDQITSASPNPLIGLSGVTRLKSTRISRPAASSVSYLGKGLLDLKKELNIKVNLCDYPKKKARIYDRNGGFQCGV